MWVAGVKKIRRMKQVFCVGELLIDFVAEKQGNDLSKANQFTKKAGGAPANVACAISLLGGHSHFVGAVGQDPFGNFLLQVLKDYGVATAHAQQKEVFTTLAFVSLDDDGERDFIFSRGADKFLSYDPALKKELTGHILHLGAATALLGGDLENAYGRYFFDALTQEVFISFDPNFRTDLWNDTGLFIKKCMPYVEKADLCKFSLLEAQLLSGKTQVAHCCEVLHKVGAKAITVTLGSEGTYLSTPTGSCLVPSTPVSALDTTGAGDAFIGCLLYQIACLDNPQEALQDLTALETMVATANRAGGITTTAYGAIPALPSREQLFKA